MFNKENKKANPLADSLNSVKIHTMKDDLTNKNEELVLEKEEVAKEDYVAREGASPFMNKPFTSSESNEMDVKENNDKNDLPIINAESDLATPTELSDENISEDNLQIEDSEKRSSLFLYVIIFVILLLVGAGGYYFWMIRGADDKAVQLVEDNSAVADNETIEQTSTDVDGPKPITDDSSSVNSQFSDKTNFLVVAENEMTQLGIKAVIERKFAEMNNYSGTQLEFLVVDKDNKPIAFKEFADIFGLSLAVDINNNLEMDNFSLFLYKKDNVKRISLALSVKDGDMLKNGLLKNEKTLLNDLGVLFVYEQPKDLSGAQFKESKYGSNSVRYVNLNKAMDLSLDYSISGNYLILATNKDSGRLIMDKLDAELVKNEDIFKLKEGL